MGKAERGISTGRTLGFSVPTTIGNYRILRELGRGGMGVVYLAEDPQRGRQIALKVLSERLARDPISLARFEREARLLASVSHPNVATLYSLEKSDRFPFLTMELVEGETLAERILRSSMSVRETLILVRQIAAGLEASHQNGVIHGDLKPSNIKVTPQGEVKVLDFGLARLAGKDPDATLDLDETGDLFCGTPGYMSPEQLRQEEVDARADVFALGCVLFECLAGVPAFVGGSFAERIAATLDREPDWQRLPEDTPPGVEDLVRRCLRREQNARLDSLTEARHEIEEELAHRVPDRQITPPRQQQYKSVDNNLPRNLASFVGRGDALDTSLEKLGQHRLLTLAGVGGCGKTRLALEVAVRALTNYPDGVWLVELAPLADPSRVLETVARALSVSEQPRCSLHETLVDSLAGKHTLIVLDNCEHVLEATASLADEILRRTSTVRILATSRESLGLLGEQVYQVPTLRVPSDANGKDINLGTESVRLFVERVQAVRPDFALDESNAKFIAQICRRLDGIPLALELAAARTRALSVEDVARRLDDRFQLLSNTSPVSMPHHQTLRALVDWSWDHLSLDEQRLLRRLSVFSGEWTLSSAEAVCTGEGIEGWQVLDLHSHLVNKSLVEIDGEARGRFGRTRYRMLETIRQYSVERLAEAKETAVFRRRHLEHYLAIAEEAEPHLRGFEQTKRFIILAADHENLRAVFDRCLELGAGPEIGLRLAGALGRYWMIRGHWREGRLLCAHFLQLCPEPTRSRALALNAAGNLAFHQGDYEQAEEFHRAALDVRIKTNDRLEEAMSWNNLGEVARLRGDGKQARQHYLKCLTVYREVDSDWGAAVALNNLGEEAQSRKAFAEARGYHKEALLCWPRLGDRWGMAFSLANLGFVAAQESDLDEARTRYARSLEISRELGDRAGTALALNALSRIGVRRDNRIEAARLLAESLEIRVALGDRKGIAECLESQIGLAVSGQDWELGARLFGAAEAIRTRLRSPATVTAHEELQHLRMRLTESLGSDGLTRLRKDGQKLSFDEVIELARAALPGEPRL